MSKSTSRHFDSPAALSCFGVLVCWSSAPLFIKYLTVYLDAPTQNLLRYAAACLFWLPFLLADAKAGRLPKAVWKRALLPFIPNVIMQSLWAVAFYYVDPGFASLLSITGFLWAITLSVVFFTDERRLLASRCFLLSLVLSVVGVAGVTAFHPAFTQSYTLIGTAIVLLYGLLWGLYAVAVKAALRNIDSRIGFSVVSIYTVIGLFILEIFVGAPAKCLEMPFAGWAATVISGVTGISLGHVFYYVSMRRLGATTSSLVLLSQPFAVLAVSHLVFGESLSVLQWVFGIALVIGSAMAIVTPKDPASLTIRP